MKRICAISFALLIVILLSSMVGAKGEKAEEGPQDGLYLVLYTGDHVGKR